MKKNFTIFAVSLLIIVVLLCMYIDKVCASDAESLDSGANLSPQEYTNLVFQNIEETHCIDSFSDIDFTSEEFIESVIGEPEILNYTNEELELLAHLIFAEAGSNWCSDKMQQYTGSVVLNRIASKYYPNTMREVIYQPGQYSVVKSGAINKIPNERAYNVARFLLENGSVLPENVIFQSQHIQGNGIYEKVQNMYFCYKN